LFGRRDNKYKARIKILVKETGLEKFNQMIEAEWQHIKHTQILTDERIADIKSHFTPPPYETDAAQDTTLAKHLSQQMAFSTWYKHNTAAHKVAGYRAVYLSLKAPETPPGDVTDQQLDAIADLADRYTFGEIRATHRQNLLFADVKQADLFILWQQLVPLKLATPNIGTATDMICCPGLDFCSLANAGSIGIAKEINEALDDIDYLHDIGELKINMSGCMNGCAHQSVGHIGILGVDKKGTEWYQITLGGSSENEAAIGDRLGPSVAKSEVTQVISPILDEYIQQRLEDEPFLATVKRVGMKPFQERVYANH
jgi:sulfite reductase (NADPH) hemoprotein beta-component